MSGRITRMRRGGRAGQCRTGSAGWPGSAFLHDERGAATAEYAVITVAAVGIAGLLVVVLRSEEVRALLVGLVHGALSVAG
jgi:Flp pilus assembly pilin Flp